MKSFAVDVRCDYAEWGRYDLFVTAVCFDEADAVVDYVNSTAKDTPLVTPPCARAEIYIYVIAREFPASDVVAASPPFDVEVVVTSSDASSPQSPGPPGSQTTATHPVNQWGGLSLRLQCS